MGAKRWLCGSCGRPIASGKGYVLVMDPKTKGHPLPPSDRRRREEEGVAQLRRDAEEARKAGDVEGAEQKEALVAAWDRIKAPRTGALSGHDIADLVRVHTLEYPLVALSALHTTCDPEETSSI